MKRTLMAGMVLGALSIGHLAYADEIIIGTNGKPGNPRVTASELFSSLIGQRSHGKFTVKIAHSATLGDDRQMLKSVKLGTIAGDGQFGRGVFGDRSGVERVRPAVPVREPSAGVGSSGRSDRRRVGVEAGEPRLCGPGVVGQRDPQDHAHQEADCDAGRHQGDEDPHAAVAGDAGRLPGAWREPGAAGVLGASGGVAERRVRRPGEPAGEHLFVAPARVDAVYRAFEPQVRDDAGSGFEAVVRRPFGGGPEADPRGDAAGRPGTTGAPS